MTDEPLLQLDQQILDGDLLMGHLRHLIDETADKGEKREMREEVREVEAKVSYMKRRRAALLTKWWSDIAGKPMPSFDESAATNAMAERFRELWVAREEAA